ncbi:MAG: hypothetical protein ACSW71_04220 [Methanobrevibacter sp.]
MNFINLGNSNLKVIMVCMGAWGLAIRQMECTHGPYLKQNPLK